MQTKIRRGLGIIRKENFNAVFLAKQFSEILTQPDNICVQLMKTKYLNQKTHFLQLIKPIQPQSRKRKS